MAGETLRDCFVDTALRCGEKRAIRFLRQGAVETEISYLDMDRDANRLAHTLLNGGVQKGDRVIFYLEKSLFFVIGHLAVQKIGAIGVPLNPGFKKSEMAYLLDDAEPRLVFAGPEKEATVKELYPAAKTITVDTRIRYQDLDFFRSASDLAPPIEVGPGDPGLIVYTSGTTGKPKGALLTQKNLVHDAKNIIRIWEITGADVLCHALPLFHVHGLCFALHTSLLAGAQVFMLDAFSPATAFDVLSRKGGGQDCTVFMAVPSMYAKMMDYAAEKDLDLGHIRLWTSGSAPLLVKDFERIERLLGKEPVEREGMSETGMNFSNPVRGKRKPGSIGTPLPGLQVRIVDPETFQDLPQGQTGEIWLKGPAVTPGYWRKPKETANAFYEGWLRTGDLGRVDDEGYYYLTDRIKHIIISGGENISPKEVEAVINRYEGVVESTVVGMPDEQWGEKVVAAVVTRPGSNVKPQELQAFCKRHLHNWKCPKEVLFVKQLPKNTMGKVLIDKVRLLFLNPE